MRSYFDWYDPSLSEVNPQAFKPNRFDIDGISVDRAHSERHPEFRRIAEAAQGRQDEYYIAELRAGDLRKYGFILHANPLPQNPGHALITDLTYANRKDSESEKKMILLGRDLVLRVGGPFPSGSE